MKDMKDTNEQFEYAIFDRKYFLEPVDLRLSHITVSTIHLYDSSRFWVDSGQLISCGDDGIILRTPKKIIKILFKDILSVEPISFSGEYARKFKETWGG
jgi:hypothetical protein